MQTQSDLYPIYLYQLSRGECSAGGVPECGGIKGCCPERYDIVYGVGLYADEDGLVESNN